MGRLRAWGSPGVCQPQRRGLGRWPVFGYVSVDPPTPPEQHAMRIRITPRQRSHHPENEAGFGFHLDRGRARQGGGAGSTPPQRRQPEPGPGLRHGSPVWCAHARRDGSGERKEPEPHAPLRLRRQPAEHDRHRRPRRGPVPPRRRPRLDLHRRHRRRAVALQLRALRRHPRRDPGPISAPANPAQWAGDYAEPGAAPTRVPAGTTPPPAGSPKPARPTS